MPRPRLPWIKVWTDMLSDAKMKQLTIAERGCFVMMMLAAQDSPVRGCLALTNTRPMTTDEIAETINLRNGEHDILQTTIEKLERLDCVSFTPDKLLKINHFIDRQNVYDSDNKDYHNPPDKLLKNPNKLLKSPDKLPLEEKKEKIKRRGDTARARAETPPFEQYLTEMATEFPSLKVDEEWKACQVWWGEKGRVIKTPKSALRNWLKIAEEKRLKKSPKPEEKHPLYADKTGCSGT